MGHYINWSILFGNVKYCDFCYVLHFLPSDQILDSFPVLYYNSQLYGHSYFQVESHFTTFCHISNLFFPWCIISSIVTSSYSCQLNTFIKLAGDTLYPHPLPKTNKDIKLTWFYSSSIEALLDTFPCLGMAIYHCFWMRYYGLFPAHETGLPYE